jgi:hypothetical protein
MSRAEEFVAAMERYMQSGDGLPVVPPTTTAVARMVENSGFAAEYVLGQLPPRLAEVRVRDVAVNAVMAGCKPEYMPVVVAAVKGLCDNEIFDTYGVAISTKGCAPLAIVNGPIRSAIELNSRGNIFGPGFRPNATIGRAIRLILMNVGNSRPNVLDRGTLGHPGRFSYCIAEDEDDSPWVPLHVERGMRPDQSAVTLMGLEAPRTVNAHYDSAEQVLEAVVDTLTTTGILNPANITGHSCHLVVFAKEHRNLLHRAGYTKPAIREYICGRAVISAERMSRVHPGVTDPTPMLAGPDDLYVVAGGGNAGRFAAVVPGWSHQSQPVTVPVEV